MTTAARAVTLRVGTRGSALARAQAEIACAALRAVAAVELETVVVRTHGDRNPYTSVEELSGQGWFSADLERALEGGVVDVAVHSAKDLAAERPTGLVVAALLPRGDPRDAVVTRDGAPLEALPPGARAGTSSRRRHALLTALWPHVTVLPIRGNVDTRLAKLDARDVDALVLAGAGLDRLGFSGRIAERLDPAVFVPAPAQGAIAIEVRSGSAAEALAREVNDRSTAVAVAAERAVLAELGGGCLLPLGAWALVTGETLTLHAALALDRGEVARAVVEGDVRAPDDAGRRAAALLQ